MNSKILRSLIVFALMSSGGLFAQTPKVAFPAPSPGGSLKQHVGLTDIEISYSRPSAKGRPIFGGLLPYGELWRTGANGPTTLSFSTDVKLNGTDIPAGKYALYTIPDKKEWTIIISKDIKGNVFSYNDTNDLVRFKATPIKLSHPVETFTIDISDIRDDSAIINLTWEKTQVPIKVELDLVSQLVPRIEEAMAAPGEKKPYYQAAMFYYDHGQNLQKAREWIEAASSANDTYYIEYVKAEILAKSGDKEGAVAAAKHSTELAIKAKADGYITLNKKLEASLR